MKLLCKQNFAELLKNIDNILLDCDGVIWGGASGQEIINNANIAINKLKAMGKSIFLVTNSSVRTQQSLLQKSQSFDIHIEKEYAVCAPYLMAQYLKSISFDKKVYIIGADALTEELESWGIRCVGPHREELIYDNIYSSIEDGTIGLDSEVGAVAVGFDKHFNYGKLVKATCYLADPDCLLLANNIDVKYPVLKTKFTIPAGGVMVKALESASGRRATVIGKPSRLMFDVLASKHQLQPDRTLMVGDTLYTDIAFGNACGLRTLFVLTGVSSLEDALAETGDCKPEFYVSSLGEISDMI